MLGSTRISRSRSPASGPARSSKRTFGNRTKKSWGLHTPPSPACSPSPHPTAWFDSWLGQLADATRRCDAERVRRLLFAMAGSSLDGEHLTSLPSAHRRHESAAVEPQTGGSLVGDTSGDRLVVVGQGYAGLPVAMRAVEVGFDVVGFDVDAAKIKRLAAGESPVEDVTSEVLSRALATGRYEPTDDPERTRGFDVAVIDVPDAAAATGSRIFRMSRRRPPCWPPRSAPERR